MTNLESWRTTDAPTQEFSCNDASCSRWFSLAARTRPPRSQTSHTILTQVEWRAIRAVARCELGLFPVINSRPRRQEPECIGTDRSLDNRAALHLRPCKETTFRSDGPCWSLPVATQRPNKCACAEYGPLPATLSHQQPFHLNLTLGCTVPPGAQHATEMKKVLDGRCIVSPGLKFHSPVRHLPRH